MTLAMELERQKKEGLAQGIEQGREEGREEGIGLGIEKNKAAMVLEMLKKKFDVVTISEITKLSVERIEEIAKSNQQLIR